MPGRVEHGLRAYVDRFRACRKVFAHAGQLLDFSHEAEDVWVSIECRGLEQACVVQVVIHAASGQIALQPAAFRTSALYI
eukprot:5132305-Prymnesium_polylepis.1